MPDLKQNLKDKVQEDIIDARPNILLITVDQMMFQALSAYGDAGMDPGIRDILSFGVVEQDNPWQKYFPGFMRLRENAVVFNQHTIASSACVPSRATIYTGQYGTLTQMLETDSLYKAGSDPAFPWLQPRGVPTIGDWFRAAGYSTHYFGKWDLSYADVDGPMKGDLNPWGFSDWRLSVPDAQGGQLNQLGVYRDQGYSDLVNGFLKRKAMNYETASEDTQPWLAVASFVNPHDIASAYPLSWWMPDSIHSTGVQTATADTPSPRPVPAASDCSNPLPGGKTQVSLNPQGFPQATFNNAPTLHESLKTKPDCQFDYSYKMGLALKSRRPPKQREYMPLPFQAEDNSDEWFAAYGQFYAYLHTLADTQINSVLQTLEDTGLDENTIVVFLSDHGEYAGAHGGMIEKWHSAYDEILRVPMVVSSPLVNADASQITYVDQITSHIDVLPTLLGLVGYDTAAQQELSEKLGDHTYFPLPGANLRPQMGNPDVEVRGPDGEVRDSVLFITDDTITEYLKGQQPAEPGYKIFLQEVDQQIQQGVGLAHGAVRQPCHIRCVREVNWKLAKYFDPNNVVSDQWEMYYLAGDAMEEYNLVHWDEKGQPVLMPERLQEAWGMDAEGLQAQLNRLRRLLVQLEEQYLNEPVSVHEAYTLDG